MFVKKGDQVLVLSGNNKGEKGKILEVNQAANKVLVEGVNIVHKHKKARSAQEQGGITKTEAGIDASKVQLICPACNKATRASNVVDENGKKSRVCKQCKAVIATMNVKADKKAAKKPLKADKAAKADKAVKTETEVKVKSKKKAEGTKE